MRKLVMATAMLAAGTPLLAAETCVTLEPPAVAAMFDDWNFALSSLNPDQVVQRYWPNAVLLPTQSNTPRTSPPMIRDYFEHFLAQRPRGRIDSRTIQTSCNLAIDMGTYSFSLMDEKGSTREVAARYTFVYQYRDGGWKILHHHSSGMPEQMAAPVLAQPASAAPHAAPSVPVVIAIPSKPAAAPQPARSNAKATKKPAAHAAEPVQKHAEPAAEPAAKPAVKTAAAEKAAKPAPVEKRDEQTGMFANLLSSPAPSEFYPPEAAKHKESGSVYLRVCADSKGEVAGPPQVLKSSGSKLLDEAAQTWARAAKWIPATYNREPVEGCTEVNVAFEAIA